MSDDERLMDWATEGHKIRLECGYSEDRMLKAAGFPDLLPKPTARKGTPDEIIARILHQDPKTLHPSDLEWWRVTVNQVIAYRDHP